MTGAELNDKSEQSSAALAWLTADWIHSQGEDRIICRIFMMCTYRLGVVISVSVCMFDLLYVKCQPFRPLEFAEPKKVNGNCIFSSIMR